MNDNAHDGTGGEHLITSARKLVLHRVEPERARFRQLLMANPNYFGNLKFSPLAPVVEIKNDTRYEELASIGFEPQIGRLEAVVHVKQTAGYDGNIHGTGSREYVRFYLSLDHGATWEDEGMGSFTAYDIPAGDGPLAYSVSVAAAPRKKLCKVANVIQMRAILSWNAPPPPDDPDFVPVWGHVRDIDILVDALRLVPLDMLPDAVPKLPVFLASHPEYEPPARLPLTSLDDATMIVRKPVPLTLEALHALYRDKGVPPARYASSFVQALARQPVLSDAVAVAGFGGFFAKLGLTPEDILGTQEPAERRESYEQLTAVGHDPGTDMLVAVIWVKKRYGYGGNPCTAGSRQYVAFHADTKGNGSFDTYLGTTSVQVYDVDDLPAHGLAYTAVLPFDSARYRQPASKGPRVLRIRAILSWNQPPPIGDPGFVPSWGNRLERAIQLAPGVAPGLYKPMIQTVGSMSARDINAATGLATGTSVLAGFTAKQSPFTGDVIIGGRIANPPDLASGMAPLRYRVEVSQDGLAWQPLTNSFVLHRDQLLDGVWTALPAIEQHCDAGYYTYREDLGAGPGQGQTFVAGNVLAVWKTNGLSGLWKLRVRVENPYEATQHFDSNIVTLRLDSENPVIELAITSRGILRSSSADTAEIGDRVEFQAGDAIEGTYHVEDAHFGSLHLTVLPPDKAAKAAFMAPAPYPGTAALPVVRDYDPLAICGVPDTGESGTWRLETRDLPDSGYVIELAAADRTIVNSGYVGRASRRTVGFSLHGPAQG
jgi:hypothetical protein